MRFSTTAAAIASALFVAGTSAQVYPPFDPETVDMNQKSQWCTVQEASCPLICYDLGKEEDINECDAESATATCTCDDGTTPDLDIYSQTVSYFVCQHQVEQCVNNCEGISICASKCRENKPCGARDPPKANNTESKTASADKPRKTTTVSEDDEFTEGFGKDGGDSKDEKETPDEKSAASIGKQYGLGLVIVGLGAGFTLFL